MKSERGDRENKEGGEYLRHPFNPKSVYQTLPFKNRQHFPLLPIWEPSLFILTFGEHNLHSNHNSSHGIH